MKLRCELQTVYRGGGGGGGSTGRRARALVMLSGRGPGLQLSAYTQRNDAGLHYSLSCLQRVFCRQLEAGRATLSFSRPAHDLLVRADALQLKAFMRQLQGVLKGGEPTTSSAVVGSVALPATPAARLSAARLLQQTPCSGDGARQRLRLRTVDDYRRQGAFPSMLRQLVASGLRLKRVERRLLALRHLNSLDLSDNAIQQLPALDLQLPQLCELKLARNQLRQLEPLSCRPADSQLAYLDVSGNQLTHLPDTLGFLQCLHYLNVADNSLTQLPDCLPSLTRLSVLSVAGNAVSWLPRCLESMAQLSELDMHGNAAAAVPAAACSLLQQPVAALPSLLCQSACVVLGRLRGRRFSAEHVPICLLELLTRAARCQQCFRACYPGDGSARVSLHDGPLRHTRASLTHPQTAALSLLQFTCWRCHLYPRRRKTNSFPYEFCSNSG